jgi:hypothetical protein
MQAIEQHIAPGYEAVGQGRDHIHIQALKMSTMSYLTARYLDLFSLLAGSLAGLLAKVKFMKTSKNKYFDSSTHPKRQFGVAT